MFSVGGEGGRWDPNGEHIIDVSSIEVEVRGGVDERSFADGIEEGGVWYCWRSTHGGTLFLVPECVSKTEHILGHYH